MKLPHDLELDADYQASKRAIHRTIEGKSGAIAKRLGIPGENGGRILRNFATIECTDKPGPLYHLARLIQAAIEEGQPEAKAAIHWLNQRFEIDARPKSLSEFDVDKLPHALVDLTANFGELLATLDSIVDDDDVVSPGEVVDTLLAAQRLQGAVTDLVARLETAARKKEGRS